MNDWKSAAKFSGFLSSSVVDELIVIIYEQKTFLLSYMLIYICT